MKKWKCTVCGYVHIGDEPPDICPVCGADKSKFIELKEEEPAKPAPPAAPAPAAPASAGKKPSRLYSFVTRQMTANKAHPVAVHVPNGVLPAGLLFLTVGYVIKSQGFVDAAFYNLVFVVAAMPLVLFSGYVDWKAKYKGVLTSVFLTKMVCGALVFSIGLSLIIWRVVAPQSTAAGAEARWAYLAVNAAMLAAATVAGFLGGRLVFDAAGSRN